MLVCDAAVSQIIPGPGFFNANTLSARRRSDSQTAGDSDLCCRGKSPVRPRLIVLKPRRKIYREVFD